MLMIDTDILIDYLRGQARALAYVDGLADRPWMSAITLGELYAGVREGRERAELDRFVRGFLVAEVDSEVARIGGLHRRQYARSHNVGFNDALIAATAEVRGSSFATLNRKHFPMLPDVIVPYQKP